MQIGFAVCRQMMEAENPQATLCCEKTLLISLLVVGILILICLGLLVFFLGKAFSISKMERHFEIFEHWYTFVQNQPNQNMSFASRSKKMNITIKKENGVITDAELDCGKKRGDDGGKH